MTTFSLATAGIAFVIALAIGKPLLNYLRARQIGKAISDEGPDSHHVKAGTPTMGGLMIFATVAILTLATNVVGRESILLPLVGIVVLGTVGLLDDMGTLQGRSQFALSWRIKVVLLFAFALGAALVLFYALDTESINIPWSGQHALGPIYIPIAVVVILATTTSVAITDGMDALAGGTLAIAFAAYGVIAVGQEQDFLVRFAFTTVGATLGFLWYNAHPAQIFMGDTGALALGGTLGVLALMTGHWLLLPVIGIVFVLEAASDIIQIGYFKLTGGKRVFRMAPIHNHFELLGWSEPQVVTRAWLLGIAGAILGVAMALQV
ncbi:MAG: phospho-N-acetylmuramoyl-pentapeptide-transferase [Chloroflexi bacterium]|nr:MAG: phospho-N-acetylmuramoyl-pentapeptide-transferase [Chloroflexota bacterium]